MKTFLALASAAVLGGWLTTGPAQAATIFDSGVLAEDVDSGAFADVSFPQEVSDIFDLTSAATIRAVEWSGFYNPSSTAGPGDNFTLRIYTNSGASPNQLPAFSSALSVTSKAPTTSGPAAGIIYEYLATTSDIALTAGTYWLSIVNDLTGDPDSWAWGRDSNVVGSPFFRTTIGSTGWFDGSVSGPAPRLDFTLYDALPAAVPVPPALGLMGLGLGALGLLRRRRKSS